VLGELVVNVDGEVLLWFADTIEDDVSSRVVVSAVEIVEEVIGS